MKRYDRKVKLVIFVGFLIIMFLLMIASMLNLYKLGDILSVIFFPFVVLVIILYSFKEKKEHEIINNAADENEKRKLQILGTQPDSSYVNSYGKKLFLLIIILSIIIALFILFFKFAYETGNTTNYKKRNYTWNY